MLICQKLLISVSEMSENNNFAGYATAAIFPLTQYSLNKKTHLYFRKSCHKNHSDQRWTAIRAGFSFLSDEIIRQYGSLVNKLQHLDLDGVTHGFFPFLIVGDN